jgi:hypothetical protein
VSKRFELNEENRYIAIQSAVSFEECAHKLIRMEHLTPALKVNTCHLVYSCSFVLIVVPILIHVLVLFLFLFLFLFSFLVLISCSCSYCSYCRRSSVL